jgi:hypothetical protein
MKTRQLSPATPADRSLLINKKSTIIKAGLENKQLKLILQTFNKLLTKYNGETEKGNQGKSN